MFKIIMMMITLLSQGCAITPNLSLTYKSAIDYRHDGDHTVKQTFSTNNPSLGSYSIIGFEYKF